MRSLGTKKRPSQRPSAYGSWGGNRDSLRLLTRKRLKMTGFQLGDQGQAVGLVIFPRTETEIEIQR